MKYRLRYAPSPTGFLHIGNTRTALMDYLFAKHYNGDFIVRIEDTDLERNVEGAIESQFDNLNWLGLFADESFKIPGDAKYGKYMQSQKFDKYKQVAFDLIKTGNAYHCFCSSEDLDADYEAQTARGIIATKYNQKCLSLTDNQIQENLDSNKDFSIRFKVPKNKIYIMNDIVRGEVSFDSKDLGDFVILKSNGIATYNFAVVIDDHDMEITHVVRGEEHISNTPRQMMIFDALGWTYPMFCHLTLIVDDSGKKLSKRSGNSIFFIEEYRKQGYLPEAMFNYIALLGWSPIGEKEILSKDELINMFDEKRFTKAPSTFDMVKMKWINSQYMKNLSDEKYLSFVKNFIDQARFDINSKSIEWLDDVLILFKRELEFGSQINNHLDLFFNNIELDDEAKNQLLELSGYENLINIFKHKLETIQDWTIENIKEVINSSGVETEVKGKDLFMPLRIFASKSQHGPSLVNVILLLGKDKVLTNIADIKSINK